MRLFGAKWEILAWKDGTDGPAWMITFAHKTIFSSSAVNLTTSDFRSLCVNCILLRRSRKTKATLQISSALLGPSQLPSYDHRVAVAWLLE